MDTVLIIFALGVVVSLVVMKGVMQANDFASKQLEQEKSPVKREGFEK